MTNIANELTENQKKLVRELISKEIEFHDIANYTFPEDEHKERKSILFKEIGEIEKELQLKQSQLNIVVSEEDQVSERQGIANVLNHAFGTNIKVKKGIE